jgi:phosphoribosylamine--glycine ligase
VTALGDDLGSAQAAAYAGVEKIRFDGAQFRRDIGARALRPHGSSHSAILGKI